ncbi:MAG TPA: DUF6210 family protein [Candidatus Angelobacter sp.]
MDADLTALKQKWLSTGSFEDEQAYLQAWVGRGPQEVPCVMVDPVGTAPPWLAVVVRRETGVVYQHQCGGTNCLQRFVEGFLIPLDLWNHEAWSYVDPNGFTHVFHGCFDVRERHYGDEELERRRDSMSCLGPRPGQHIPAPAIDRLRRLVQEFTMWRSDGHVEDAVRDVLRLDESRIDEIVEGWIPVETPDGPGVLLAPNCD